MMPRLPIAPKGPTFSRMVYGTWRILSEQPTPQEINRRLQLCVELGITTIDTAEIYGLYEVERALGEALALSPGLRDKLEIQQGGHLRAVQVSPRSPYGAYNASGPRMVKSLEKSLRFLGTDHVELLLVHRPDWLTRADDTAGGLNQLLREGKIRAAGVSNYHAAKFDLLNSRMERPLATNQVEFHLLCMDPIYDGTLAPMREGMHYAHGLEPSGGRAPVRSVQRGCAADRQSGGGNVRPLPRGVRGGVGLRLDPGGGPSRPLPIIGTNQIERIRSAAARGQYRTRNEKIGMPSGRRPRTKSAVDRLPSPAAGEGSFIAPHNANTLDACPV